MKPSSKCLTHFQNQISAAAQYHNIYALGLITCYFNPGGYSSKFLNYQQFKLRIQAAGLKLITIECAVGKQPFQLATTSDIIQVRAQNILWQKERLLNIALRHLPPEITKVAWLDADILFSNPCWAVDTAKQLELYPVVQPFSYAIRLLPGQSVYQGEADNVQRSFAATYHKNPEYIEPHSQRSHGHTGYVWAARRDILERYGLYDGAILGSADRFMAYAFANQPDHPCLEQQLGRNNPRADHFKRWAEPVATAVQGKIGYVKGAALHLWHGNAKNRNYIDRHRLLEKYDFDPEIDIIYSVNGAWEWSCDKPELRKEVINYFHQRQEDNRD